MAASAHPTPAALRLFLLLPLLLLLLQIVSSSSRRANEVYKDSYGKERLLSSNIWQVDRGLSDRPTLWPARNFHPEEDVQKLQKALNFPLNENGITEIMTKRTDLQRQDIVKYYPNLKRVFGQKLSFGFERIMVVLATRLAEFQAEQLKEAFKFSVRIDEDLVIEMLCTRNRQIRKIREAYKRLYGKDIDQELTAFSLNRFGKFLASYTQGNRDERKTIDRSLAISDAREWIKAGRLSIDNNTPFKKILISRSFPQLKLTFAEYKRISSRSIMEAVTRDFSGDTQKGLMKIVKSIENKANYFAEILNDGIKTPSKREKTLIRVIVTRAEIDMEDIKDSYRRLYGVPLSSPISASTDSSKKALLSLISA